METVTHNLMSRLRLIWFSGNNDVEHINGNPHERRARLVLR